MTQFKRLNPALVYLVFLFFISGMQDIQAQDAYGMADSHPLQNNIQFNPAGFLQFGPMIQAEFVAGEHLVIFPHIRFAGLGLLSQLTTDYDNLDPMSMGLGAGFRIFPGTGKHRPYFGAALEYGWANGSDEADGYSPKVEYENAYISIVGNGGFRWRFNTIFIQAGGYAGVIIETKDRRVDPPLDYGNDVEFLAMLEFAFGFEF